MRKAEFSGTESFVTHIDTVIRLTGSNSVVDFIGAGHANLGIVDGFGSGMLLSDLDSGTVVFDGISVHGLSLTLTAVPEPTSALLLLFGGLCCVGFTKRRVRFSV